MDYASSFAKKVHSYLPKWCILIYRIGALLVTENGALLFTDHNGIHCPVSHFFSTDMPSLRDSLSRISFFFYKYAIPTGLETVTLNPF